MNTTRWLFFQTLREKVFHSSLAERVVFQCLPYDLLHIGSEESRVLGSGSIPVAILPSCQDMRTNALGLQKLEYSG